MVIALLRGGLLFVSAESIRITSWNLELLSRAPGTPASNRLDIAAVTSALQGLDPDVILLQRVPDEDTCARLAQGLKPSDYKVVVCSAFGAEPAEAPKPAAVTPQEDLRESLESQIRQTKAEVSAAEKQLEQNRSALGAIGQELVAQDITNWVEVTPEGAEAYREIARQIETLGDQERDLLHRGYKEAHPLVQSVRTQLRTFSTRKAELERNFPTLKYLVIGTNAPDWWLASRLKENELLNARVVTLQSGLRSLEAEFSKLVDAQHKPAEASDAKRSGDKPSQRSQVAILAKQKAYFSCSRPWGGPGEVEPGGFAFCAIQTAKQRVGLFSVELSNDLQATGAVHQLVGEIGSIRKWEQNQVDTFLLACSFENTVTGATEERSQALRVIYRAGFSDALGDLAADESAAGPPGPRAPRKDWMFVEATGLALNPQAAAGPEGRHQPITCDVELDPTKVAAGRLARVEAQTIAPLRDLKLQRFFPAWVEVLGFAAISFLGLGWILGRRSNRLRKVARLLPVRAQRGVATPSSYTVIVAPTSITGSGPDPAALPPVMPLVHLETPGPGPTQSGSWEQRALAAENRVKQAEAVIRQGLLPYLSRWMREKLLRKLLVDRSQLLAAQEEATRKVMAVDARLTKLEVQIQQQTRVYVKRIEDLTAELLAAKEENRELIRAKIIQVKIEMETARRKLVDQQTKTGGE